MPDPSSILPVASEFAPGIAPSGGVPAPHFELLLNRAEEALASVGEKTEREPAPAIEPFRLREFDASSEAGAAEPAFDEPLPLAIEVGRARLSRQEVQKLAQGELVVLDRASGEAVDIVVAGQLIARGEIVVLQEKLCVRVTELVKRLAS